MKRPKCYGRNSATFNQDRIARRQRILTRKPPTPVICENTGQEFPSVKLAAEFFEISPSSVLNSCIEKRFISCKGLAFNYKPSNS